MTGGYEMNFKSPIYWTKNETRETCHMIILELAWFTV